MPNPAVRSNSELVREFFEVIWNQRRIERIGEFIGPQSVLHSDTGDIIGPEQFTAMQYIPFTTAFPDPRVELPGVIEQGDTVAARWVGVGTHTGDGLGFAPTGKQVEFHGISWIIGQNGKFGEGWQNSNIEEVIRRLLPK